MLNGRQAQVYADHFIGVHLKEIAGGKSYSEVSAAAQADPSNAALANQVQLLFRGSTLRGLFDAFGISISYGLQHGVPLKNYVRALRHMSFAPSGITDDPEIRTASSIIDYIFHKLALTYLSFDDRIELGLASLDDMPDTQISLPVSLDAEPQRQVVPMDVDESLMHLESEEMEVTAAASTAPSPSLSQVSQPEPQRQKPSAVHDAAAPLCFNCGNQTQRAGSCYVCTACGSTTGCS